MPITTAETVAAEAAKRMLADAAFVSVLDRIREKATQQAVFEPDPLAREAQRQLVLAIVRLWDELRGDAELPAAVKERDIMAKAFE